MVRFTTGPGPDDWVTLDAHPRHARALGYPEDCCWPGSRIQSCERNNPLNVEANIFLEKLENLNVPKESYPDYPFIHNSVVAISLREIKEGDELLPGTGGARMLSLDTLDH